MKTLTTALFSGALLILAGSFTPAKVTDPLKLYAQINRSQAPNTISGVEKSKGWQLLFDGKTPAGWHEYNLKTFSNSWIIEDGAFTTTTRGGAESQDIVTDKTYRNFAFSVDFKLMQGTNSGIIFQVKEDPKYKFPYETGPEFQIIDQSSWPDKLETWQVMGANYAMYPPKSFPAKPVGEWNHLMFVVNGNHVTQILNGVIVVEYDKNSPEWTKLRNSGKWAAFPDWGKFDEGNISLQNHGTQIWFRNIKLKEL